MIFARVENGVTKISPKRQKTPTFSKEKLDHGVGGGAGSLTSVVGPRRTSSATRSPYPTARAVASLDGASIRNA